MHAHPIASQDTQPEEEGEEGRGGEGVRSGGRKGGKRGEGRGKLGRASVHAF